MRISKENERTSNKPIRKRSSTASVKIHEANGESAQERFDKNNLSEADMDRILANF